MEQNNLDRIVKDTYAEFNSEMDVHSDIDIPDFNNIMTKFNANLNEKSIKSSIFKKIVLLITKKKPLKYKF